jgi:hypothetical protein
MDRVRWMTREALLALQDRLVDRARQYGYEEADSVLTERALIAVQNQLAE